MQNTRIPQRVKTFQFSILRVPVQSVDAVTLVTQENLFMRKHVIVRFIPCSNWLTALTLQEIDNVAAEKKRKTRRKSNSIKFMTLNKAERSLF